MSDEIDQVLHAFLQEALPLIERTVTRALHDGRKLSELAFDLERGRDDQTRGGCAPRTAVAKRWRSHPDIDEEKRIEISAMILDAPPDEIPIVMTIAAGRFTVYGVKCLGGDLVAAERPEKPN